VINDIGPTEIHTAELLVPEQSAFEVELATEELKSHKSPGSDQIPTELINSLNAKLNPNCPLLVLFGAHHVLHVCR